MAEIVNSDKLSFVLTNYGLQRVAEALQNENVRINITKGKVGDANGEFYIPSEAQTSLRNPITDGSFPIVQKELLEDNLTVSFLFKMPESFGDCDIREVGLYETIDEVDYLFAIGTQQPIVKPSVANNYLIFIDYYILLKSTNLAEVYEQIILNPNNQIVTELDLQNLMGALLFTQGNLSLQIEKNSHIIGLNRGTLLYDNIYENREASGYLYSSQLYTHLLNLLNDEDNIFSYWVFNYSNKTSNDKSIRDFSLNENNLSCNKNLNLYEKQFLGVLPALSFNSPNYYYLNSNTPLILTDSSNHDIPFSLLYAVEPITLGVDRTIVARSNYTTHTHAFEVNELANGTLQVKLFSDQNNYLTFNSISQVIPNSRHSVLLSYDNTERTFVAYVNGQKTYFNKEVTGNYTNMSTTPTVLYAFVYNTSKIIYGDSNSTVTTLYNADGTEYSGTSWEIVNGKPYYDSIASTYSSGDNIQTSTLYAWTYTESPSDYTIYTKSLTITEDTVLYNSDYTVYEGTAFEVALVGDDYIIQYNSNSTYYDSDNNIASITLYAWLYEGIDESIWSNSSSNPVLLFDAYGNLYEGTTWTISNNSVLYEGNVSTYTSALNKNIPALEVTSFLVDGAGNKTNLVDSNISLLSFIVNQKLSEENLRTLSLLTESALGNNPCIILS